MPLSGSLRVFWSLMAVIVLAIPLVGAPSLTDLTFRTCSLIILAVSWNMMASAGLISLGHSAFFGVGAYTAVLAANGAGIGFVPSLFFALLAGGVVGCGLALVTGRLQGIYFAICTLATSEGLRVIAVMLEGVTGGAQGQYLKASLSPGVLAINLAASMGALLAAGLSYQLSRTRFQYAFRAMRANEHASKMLGINPLVYRVFIVSISGAMSAVSGALGIWYSGFLDPGVAFNLNTTLMVQTAAILGGVYTLPGPLLGAVAAMGIGETARAWLGSIEGASLLLFGVTMIICVTCLPHGIQGAIARLLARRRSTQAAEAVK